jgi:hypothetical protein
MIIKYLTINVSGHPTKLSHFGVLLAISSQHHDSLYNDTQHNNTKFLGAGWQIILPNDIQPNNSLYNGSRYDNIESNDTQNSNT